MNGSVLRIGLLLATGTVAIVAEPGVGTFTWVLAADAPASVAPSDAGARREVGSLVMEGVPELPPALVERLRPYQNTRSASLQDWLADGKGLLITTRFGETAQVHQVSNPLGDRRQLTFYSEPILDAVVCPDPTQHGFLFLRDTGGAENYQIYFRDLHTGATTLVSDGSSRNTGPAWSNRGDRFAYASTRRNGRDQDLYVADVKSPAGAKRVLERDGTWSVVDWSPDDLTLLVQREVSVNESHLYLLDLASSALDEINPRPVPVAYGTAHFARKGRGVYLTSDDGSEFQRLRYYDIAKKKMSDLVADLPWDIEGLAVSRQGDRLAFTVNENGFDRLWLYDTSTKTRTRPAGVPEGLVGRTRFKPDGTALAFTVEAANVPGDVYVLRLGGSSVVGSGAAAAAAAVTRWTQSEVGGLDASRFVTPQAIDYPTFDQANGVPRKIPALYYRPRGQGPFPVIISIHGGPEGQARAGFSPNLQMFTEELGFAVLAPNVRGSTGYGKTYVTLDNADKREDSVKDIGALFDWIATRPELDTKRIAVYGGSYGGYMSLATMTHYSDRLKGGIDVVGISNFVTFLQSTSGYRQDLRRVEYGDERDPKMRAYLESISPLNHVDGIRVPVLIVQGRNDPRVPFKESEQMLAAIKKNGNDAWYLMAKDEGHGFRKKSNVDFFVGTMALFLETKVAGMAPGGEAAPSKASR
jgi:dipeptidyl aminopeptidase/acylaminoacyl peptidase